MKLPKKIIVGHDLGLGGQVALGSAVVLANRCGSELRIVHVVEPLDAYQRLSHPLSVPYSQEELVEKIAARLKTLLAGPELAGLQAQYEVRSGKPFIELIIAARALPADLIVVGSASEAVGLFLGSTSERIVRKAQIPVMVAKKPLRSKPRIILVPTDFSLCARKAAEEALMLAKSFPARVAFFHVVDPYLSRIAYAHELGVSVPVPPPSPREIEPVWDVFLSELALAKVDWERSVGEGQAATAIVQQAENIEADMIVMGTHGRSGLPHMLLGSVAEKVVRAAPCCVLTVRPEGFQFQLP
jgi:nucleotide-binding universal stress UspA family protein